MTKMMTRFLCTLTFLALAGCSQWPDANREAGAQLPWLIQGQVTYRARIALPPDSKLIVTLHATTSEGAPGKTIAEHIRPTRGQQVPLSFALSLDQALVETSAPYFLSALIKDGQGVTRWQTDSPQPLTIRARQTDAGTLTLVQPEPQNMDAMSDTEPYSISDKEPYSISDKEPYSARGNEPGWMLKVTSTQIQLIRHYGTETLQFPAPGSGQQGEAILLESDGRAGHLAIRILAKVCHDSMSGMPYPDRVEVQLNDEHFRGCGGNPVSLLTGAEWVVEDLDNRGIIDRSRMSLLFTEDGRVSGMASCNRYFAQYQLTGESLTFSAPGSTLMACAPALNEQEQRFLKLLTQVNRFDIDRTGALLLKTPQGGTILARRL